jgi:hypothetical protein
VPEVASGLILLCVLVLPRCLCLRHLGERPEVLLAQFGDEVCLLAVRDYELFVDDHLHEARLVRQLLELQLEFAGEEVLG